MKKIFTLLLFSFIFNNFIKSQTYFAIGVDKLHLVLQENPDKSVMNEDKLSQPCMRIVYGYEDIWAYKIQIEGNPDVFALLSLGVGYRPLHKMDIRLQPMIYGNFGLGSTEDGRTESEVKENPKMVYSFSPELSFDYFLKGRTALGLYISNPLIFNSENAMIVNQYFSGQFKSGTQLGLILKIFL